MKKLLIIAGAVMSGLLAMLVISCATEATEKGGSSSSSSSGDISGTYNYVNTKYVNGETDSRKTSQTAWNMANCHDPKLFQDDDGTYYVYATDASCGNIGKVGLHIRYSTDLVNWTGVSTSALAGNWDEDFLAWEGFVASSSETLQNNTSYTAFSWAPTVIKQNGLYYMYHGVNADVAHSSGTSWASSICLAIASSAKGPFYPASYITSYSGSNSDILAIQTKLSNLGVSYSQNFLVRYSALANKTRTAKSSLDGVEIDNPDYSISNNGRFGCIDPEFVFDMATGELMTYTIGSNTCYAMIYGSWMYGISLIYVDATSLKPVATEAFTDGDSNSISIGDELDMSLDEANYYAYPSNSSAYHLIGTRIAGGYWAGYEGAQLFYNSETEYYYLITSCGGLDYEYRCTLGRSQSIEGPYYDANGVNMVLCNDSSADNYSKNYHAIGAKIIGSHVLNGEYSFRCQGGLSIIRNSDGKILFANHSRTNFQYGYYFYLQIHQMFFNADGWPVLNQNEYYPDYSGLTSDGTESLSALSTSDIVGTYNTILTVRGTTSSTASACGIYGGDTTSCNKEDATPTTSKTMTLKSDGSISGSNYSGSWTMGSDGYSLILYLSDASGNSLGVFKGCMMHAVDWAVKGGADATRRTITFTTLCYDDSNSSSEAGEFFWGNKIKN